MDHEKTTNKREIIYAISRDKIYDIYEDALELIK
jgi:hypothetical protein